MLAREHPTVHTLKRFTGGRIGGYGKGSLEGDKR